MTFRLTATTSIKVPEPRAKQRCGWQNQALNQVGRFRYSVLPLVLIIEEKPELVCLLRFTTDGRCIGNTWHRTVDGARQQAGIEFNDLFLDWTLIPSDVEDVLSFALAAQSRQG